MMNLKKAIATLAAAMILTTGTVSVASAGGIKDFFSGVGGMITNGVKTAYHAVVDTGEYVFTDKSAEECYDDTVTSAKKAANSACDTVDGVVKTAEDIAEFAGGAVETVGGAVATGVTAVVETAVNVATGSDNYNWTSNVSDLVTDGYEHMDNGFDTVVEAASLVNPTVAIVANGVRIVKAAGEAAVGYKDRDWSDVGETVVESGMNIAASAVGGMASARVASSSAITAGTAANAAAAATGTAAKATMKIVNDLNNDDDTRSAVDIVVEDLTNTALTGAAAFGTNMVVTH